LFEGRLPGPSRGAAKSVDTPFPELIYAAARSVRAVLGSRCLSNALNVRKLTIMIIANAVLVLAATGLIVRSMGPHPPATPRAQGTAASQTARAPGSIDELVAPIALYPDQLLAQMLMCASDPDNVRRLHEWLKVNPTLKGTELQDAALLANFEPSFVALSLFPQVVSTMAEKIEWTTLLGQAFAADKSAVFGSIQKLRAQARDVCTLKTTPQQQVETKTTSAGQEVIVIEPTNPQVVYVPQYNPTVVYTTAPTTTTQTIIIEKESDTSSADAAAAGLIGFTAGIAIGAAVNNSYYYGPYGMYGGAYMYNDAWDDYYDHREDAREDWQDHREDLNEERGDRREDVSENRGDRAGTTQEQRTERQQNRTENRPESQAAREQRRTDAQGQVQQRQASGQTASTQSRTAREGSYESRGYSNSGSRATAERSGTKSDAFSGYSSGKSTRAASSRGSSSRGSSRSRGGGGGRRR